MADPKNWITTDLRSTVGGGRYIKLSIITDCKKGTTQAVLEYTVVERMPITRLPHARELYDKLDQKTRVVELDDILSIR